MPTLLNPTELSAAAPGQYTVQVPSPWNRFLRSWFELLLGAILFLGSCLAAFDSMGRSSRASTFSLVTASLLLLGAVLKSTRRVLVAWVPLPRRGFERTREAQAQH